MIKTIFKQNLMLNKKIRFFFKLNVLYILKFENILL